MLIESDDFPFEFISVIAEKESWRKEVHRPIYHVHKWWAKRLGSVFRGILLGSILPKEADFEKAFYDIHSRPDVSVFDPFMGSGTTIGEAHKLGFTSFGKDINPIAAEAVRVALGPMQEDNIQAAFNSVSAAIKPKIQDIYATVAKSGQPATVLYYFWVMTAPCLDCKKPIDLFSSYVISSDAYPKKKPIIQILCPSCGDIFEGHYQHEEVDCPQCSYHFNPRKGPVSGSKVKCSHCDCAQTIGTMLKNKLHRPEFRLYGKLVLTKDKRKEYVRATTKDFEQYEYAKKKLQDLEDQEFLLPSLRLEPGYNTQQAINYNFNSWRDFFNERQLLVLGLLQQEIAKIEDIFSRDALLTLFSSTLEFSNLFASYKGEGTGAVRHMFAHHILKPERTPIETNVWGTEKSSGSFSGLFKTKLLRAIAYRKAPREVGQDSMCKYLFFANYRFD
jgi:putative DNA methylase